MREGGRKAETRVLVLRTRQQRKRPALCGSIALRWLGEKELLVYVRLYSRVVWDTSKVW